MFGCFIFQFNFLNFFFYENAYISFFLYLCNSLTSIYEIPSVLQLKMQFYEIQQYLLREGFQLVDVIAIQLVFKLNLPEQLRPHNNGIIKLIDIRKKKNIIFFVKVVVNHECSHRQLTKRKVIPFTKNFIMVILFNKLVNFVSYR